MKRVVRIEDARYLSMSITLMVERYSSSNTYPSDLAYFDDNLNTIISKSDLKKLPRTYIDAYICGILGRSGSLSGSAFTQNFNSKIPEYDFSIYPIGEELDLEFDGYILITDTELIDTKKDVMEMVESANSVSELVDDLKERFNLTEKTEVTPTISEAGKSPNSLRPKDLAGITALFSQYLTNPSYIKGNCVEFEITNPYSDFIVDNVDTELMVAVRDFYSDWDSIEVEEVPVGLIVPKEVFPIANQDIYLLVGTDYVKVLPKDIDIDTGQDWQPMFGNGTLLPMVGVLDGSGNFVPLVITKLRMKDADGNITPFTGIRYRSRATGIIGTDLYYLNTTVNPPQHSPIPNLSTSLAMFSRETKSTSSTKFRFYFK